AGGFAPTLGIIGTVVGLVSVLSNLANIGKLAPSIATAFIATLWGVSSANLFWLPVSSKLKSNLRREIRVREMIIEGCVSIAGGENPRLIKEQLEILCPPERHSSGKTEDESHSSPSH
ncbi:MotA/TolQ/ExbB proton channel, partial [mine drainage metagenome]